MFKECSKCKKEKKLEEFSKDKAKKDGKQSKCKACNKEYKKKLKTKAYVYQIRNELTGQVYIGSSSRSDRWAKHKTNAFNPKYRGYNYTIYQNIREHGLENFYFEVLLTFKNLKEAREFEKRLIECQSKFEDHRLLNKQLVGEVDLKLKEIMRILEDQALRLHDGLTKFFG